MLGLQFIGVRIRLQSFDVTILLCNPLFRRKVHMCEQCSKFNINRKYSIVIHKGLFAIAIENTSFLLVRSSSGAISLVVTTRLAVIEY